MSFIFKIALYAYFLASATAAFGAWSNAGAGTAAALSGASMLAWFGGSGLRGSLIAGDKSQNIGGMVFAALFFFAAHWLATSPGFIVGLFGTEFGGGIWWIIGAVIGFLATAKKDTEPRPEVGAQPKG
jgi:hypothetical protein